MDKICDLSVMFSGKSLHLGGLEVQVRLNWGLPLPT